MTNAKKITISIIAILVLIAGGWYVISRKSISTGTAGAGNTVATVNGESISRSDLTTSEAQITSQQGATAATSTEAQAALQTQALNALIAQKLLEQAAHSAGVTASSTEVDAQVQAAKAQFGTEDAYNQALTAQGLTEDTLRAELSDNVLIQDYLSQTIDLASVTATDAEIQAAYDQVAAGQTGVPALKDVRDQVKQMVIGQKQQQLVSAQIDKLRAAADVKILI